MRQQINLLTLIPKPPSVFLNVHVMLIGCGIFFIYLLYQSAFAFDRYMKLSRQRDRLQLELIHTKQNYEVTLAQYPMVNIDDLTGSMGRLQTDVKNKTKLMTLLSNPIKFSDYLTAFASADIKGIWLETINISNMGLKIDIHGEALKESYIYDYHRHILQQALFKNMNITVQDIAEKLDEKKQKVITFNLIGATIGVI